MSNDPTETIRRELIPEVNRQAHDALVAAGELVRQVAEAGGVTEVTDEEGEALLKDRDELAAGLLRARLVAEHGADNVFDTGELSEHFEVEGFRSPLVVVRRKVDDQLGSLWFTHHPRFYYGFQPDRR
jgi:hypothetical protein